MSKPSDTPFVLLAFPPGWKVQGTLSIEEPTALDESFLTEDLLQLTTPDGMIIDVGWYPESNRGGAYTCRIIRSPDAWDEPSSVLLRTTSTQTLLGWLVFTVAQLMRGPNP